MVEITESDDGCIDGRPAVNLIMPSTDTVGNFEETAIENPYEHIRAKVAGGGYLTSLAMKLALDPHITHINEDLKGVAEHLHTLVCAAAFTPARVVMKTEWTVVP